jgi:mRNA interferase YafQ
MRRIELTRSFKRDYRRILANPRHREVDPLLASTMERLAQDQTLEARFHDHLLTGDFRDHRECHLKPDLLLIYWKPNDETVLFVRLGSHSELFWRHFVPYWASRGSSRWSEGEFRADQREDLLSSYRLRLNQAGTKCYQRRRTSSKQKAGPMAARME